VLTAAGTKWNFLPFKPGLVGGHCIGVDPYYLTHKAQQLGYYPYVILAGRRINDGMGAHVAHRVIRLLSRRRVLAADAKVLVLGLAFKPNCSDLRNTRVVDLITVLHEHEAHVDVVDPRVDPSAAQHEYGLDVHGKIAAGVQYDAVILAVAHNEFIQLGAAGIRALCKPGGVLFDVQQALPREAADDRL